MLSVGLQNNHEPARYQRGALSALDEASSSCIFRHTSLHLRSQRNTTNESITKTRLHRRRRPTAGRYVGRVGSVHGVCEWKLCGEVLVKGHFYRTSKNGIVLAKKGLCIVGVLGYPPCRKKAL